MKHLLFIISILCYTSCSINNAQSNYHTFNASEKYPVANINLDDIARVEYIKLKPIDSMVISCSFTTTARELLVTKDNIFYCDKSSGVVGIFDRNGNQLSYINKIGRGPGEYIELSLFNIDTIKREVYISDHQSKKMLGYDYNGNCIFSIQRPKSVPPYSATEMLNDSTFLGYYSYGREEFPLLSIFNQQYESIQTPHLKYERPFVVDYEGTLEYSRIISAQDGVFISDMRSDTIFFLNGKSQTLAPRFVDVSSYGSDDVKIYPTIETSEYIFFSRLFSQILTPEIKRKYYCFNKKEQQFYILKQMTIGDKKDYAQFLDEQRVALMRGYIELESINITQNHNIAATFIPVQTILKHYAELPEDLQKKTANIHENDDPILMIIHFNSN